jgi:hypothetical protein
MLLGLVRPSAGAALIGGRPYPWLPHPRRTAGAVLEATGAHPGRRARDHLRILAQVTGVPDGRVAEVCDQVGLAEPADRRVGRLLPRHAPAPRPGRGAARRPACLAEEHSPERRESTMKQYLLSIYQPDSDPPPADVLAEIMRDVRAADEELRSAARVGVLRRPSRAVVRAVTGHRG